MYFLLFNLFTIVLISIDFKIISNLLDIRIFVLLLLLEDTISSIYNIIFANII
jgi:hypothetical protein